MTSSFPSPTVQDEISRQFGNQDGVTFCGARKYSILNVDQYDFLLFNQASGLITFKSLDQAQIGEYTIDALVELEDDPSITQ